MPVMPGVGGQVVPRSRGISRLTLPPQIFFLDPFPATLPGSSVAEQVTVNHLVAGSIPARAAIRRDARVECPQAKSRGFRLRGSTPKFGEGAG